MTFLYIHPVLYRCDGARCSAEAEASSVRLPTGWKEATVLLTTLDGPGADARTIHLCPTCQAPESK